MRVKTVPRVDFEPVMEFQWKPVELSDESWPDFARSIPPQTRYRFLASGEANNATPYSSNEITSGFLVGGFDVYRHSPDDPVRFNKDRYAVVDPGNGADTFLVDGPYKDHEHWLDEVPRRYDGAPVLTLPGRPTE